MSEPVVVSAEPATATPSGPPAPVLRREAILPRERRGGLGAVALLCSLAGIASGFALATTILATQIAQSEARYVRRASLEAMHERTFLGIKYDDRGGPARISRVLAGTPAAEVGLAAGDVIVTFDAEPLDREGELGARVRSSDAGHEATIEVRRGDTTTILHPTLIRARVRDF